MLDNISVPSSTVKQSKQNAGNTRERDHLEDLGIAGRIIIKWIFKKWDGDAWTGLIWFRIGIGGGLL
jgi:hypothetical protein